MIAASELKRSGRARRRACKSWVALGANKMNTRIPPMLFTAIAMLMFCLVRTQAPARIITVTNTNDSGPGSLRDALTIATDDDLITFVVTGTITLTSGQLVVNKNVVISGPGADLLRVSGNASHRVLFIRSPGPPLPRITVSVSGLTITDGASDTGAGIENLFAEVIVSECIISNNSASEDGGGIANVGGTADETTLTINNSTIIGNSARPGGAGIYNYNANSQGGGATLIVNNSTINVNSAHDGGGVYNIARSGRNGSGSATVTISNSTISGNTATGNVGGGIYTEGNNGGLFFGIARLTVNNSTISGNSARLLGGGIYDTGATVSIGQTILNTGPSGQNIYRNSGAVTSLGYNLSNDNGNGLLTGPGDQINTDPLLGPLQNNGGPTFTHALLPGSPGIDAGNPSFSPPPIMISATALFSACSVVGSMSGHSRANLNLNPHPVRVQDRVQLRDLGELRSVKRNEPE